MARRGQQTNDCHNLAPFPGIRPSRRFPRCRAGPRCVPNGPGPTSRHHRVLTRNRASATTASSITYSGQPMVIMGGDRRSRLRPLVLLRSRQVPVTGDPGPAAPVRPTDKAWMPLPPSLEQHERGIHAIRFGARVTEVRPRAPSTADAPAGSPRTPLPLTAQIASNCRGQTLLPNNERPIMCAP
jgi:hypothetical protein